MHLWPMFVKSFLSLSVSSVHSCLRALEAICISLEQKIMLVTVSMNFISGLLGTLVLLQPSRHWTQFRYAFLLLSV